MASFLSTGRGGRWNPFMSLLKNRLPSAQKHQFARAARAARAKLQQPQQNDQSGSQWPALAYLGRILRQIESHGRGAERLDDKHGPSDAAKIARRDLLRVLAVGAAVATTSGCASAEAAKFPDKRKARYQADSADVQSFYRVNRYPAK